MVDEVEMLANMNLDKGCTLAKGFFLSKPPADDVIADYNYPSQCEYAGKITLEQINVQLRKLKPYKALGSDGISNIVLTKSTDLIVDRLLYIYKAIIERNLMYKPGRNLPLWSSGNLESLDMIC
jgi:hypothetical protein